MTTNLNVEELKQAIRAARIYCPCFTEQQFQSLMEMEKRLADTGWLQAVQELARIMEKRGVTCSQALDEYQALLGQNESLKKAIASLQGKSQGLQAEVNQRVAELKEEQNAVRQAKNELAKVNAERQRQEQDLAAFRAAAEKEKAGIEKDLDRCRRQADVTREEVDSAGELKKLVASCGFTVDLAVGLCQEFGSHEEARAELLEAIEEYGALTEANAVMAEQGATQKKSLESEIDKLRSQRDEWQAALGRVKEDQANHGSLLQQLRADLAEQNELRRFYRRYHGVHVLLDNVASWPQVHFAYCEGAVCKMHRVGTPGLLSRVWTDKQPMRCPSCGFATLVYDEKIYRALNLPKGPVRLVLGG